MRPVFMGVKVKLWSCAVNAAVSLSFVLASFLFSGGCFAGFARLRVMSNACLFAACATKSTMRSFWNHFKGRRGSLRHETVHRSAFFICVRGCACIRTLPTRGCIGKKMSKSAHNCSETTFACILPHPLLELRFVLETSHFSPRDTRSPNRTVPSPGCFIFVKQFRPVHVTIFAALCLAAFPVPHPIAAIFFVALVAFGRRMSLTTMSRAQIASSLSAEKSEAVSGFRITTGIARDADRGVGGAMSSTTQIPARELSSESSSPTAERLRKTCLPDDDSAVLEALPDDMTSVRRRDSTRL